MSIHASRARRLGHYVSSALTALIISDAVARAQDQPVPTPPSQEQTQPSQEQTPPPAPPAQTSSPPSTPAESTPSSPPSPPPPQVSGGGAQLPQITVRAPVIKRPPARIVRALTIRPPPRPPPRVATPTTTVPSVSAAERLTEQQNSFDQARSNLYTTVGTTSDTKSHETIDALPQGANAPVERVLLQAPGVSQDSAASGLFHVRNDHANAQYRINGILLPDGVSGFGSIFDITLSAAYRW